MQVCHADGSSAIPTAGAQPGQRPRRANAASPPGQDPPVNFAYRFNDIAGTMSAMGTTSVAAEVRKRVLASRDRFWRPEDFAGSPDAVAQGLSRLARSGEVRRIRRGLYWRGAPTPLGMAPPPPGRLASEITGGMGAGPAGWSAALALGLSTQVARREAVAVPGRAPRGPSSLRYVSRAAATKRREERLRPGEVALLEVLRDWERLVEVPPAEAVARIARLADDATIRLDRVARASDTEPPRARERLRQLLVALGREDMAGLVRPARSPAVRRDPALAG